MVILEGWVFLVSEVPLYLLSPHQSQHPWPIQQARSVTYAKVDVRDLCRVDMESYALAAIANLLLVAQAHYFVGGFGYGLVQGSGFRVQGSGSRVQGPGSRVQGAGLRVQSSGCRVQGAGFRMQGL